MKSKKKSVRKLSKEELLAIVGGSASAAEGKPAGDDQQLASTYACFVFYCTYSTGSCGSGSY